MSIYIYIYTHTVVIGSNNWRTEVVANCNWCGRLLCCITDFLNQLHHQEKVNGTAVCLSHHELVHRANLAAPWWQMRSGEQKIDEMEKSWVFLQIKLINICQYKQTICHVSTNNKSVTQCICKCEAAVLVQKPVLASVALVYSTGNCNWPLWSCGMN